MNKDFVPYEEAFALRELGYDEICMGAYIKDNDEVEFEEGGVWRKVTSKKIAKAPLYQQAFRWFREKHDIHSFTDLKWKKNGWDFEMVDMNKMETISSLGKYGFESQEKAEIACLKKLIEIIKEK